MTTSNYSGRLSLTEEIVGSVIDVILTAGGKALYHRYLERKTFTYSADAISEALVGNLKMCYVAHDDADDNGPDWQIEDEPQPCCIDNWARMRVTVRKPRPNRDNVGVHRQTEAARGAQEKRLREKEAKRKEKESQNQKDLHSEDRSKPIAVKIVFDEEEQRIRDKKAQEEAAKRDKEKQAKQAEKSSMEDTRKAALLYEELDRRQHTFDSDGNIIWVEEVHMDRLPRTHELFGVKIQTGKQEANARASKELPDKKARQKRPQRSKARSSDKFTDGFSKLQYGQPPIHETLACAPGVSLFATGKSKTGPSMEGSKRTMSRKEYLEKIELDVEMDQHTLSFLDEDQQGSPTGSLGVLDSSSATHSNDVSPPAALSSPGNELPALEAGRGPAAPARQEVPGMRKALKLQGSGVGGIGSVTNPKREAEKIVRTEMPAPSPMARSPMKRFESIGHLGRPPRLHMSPLGGSHGIGSPQPVLGATMGHGLLRSRSMFFPSAKSDAKIPMTRSSSEASLYPGSNAGRSPLSRYSTRGSPTSPHQDEGRLIPDQRSSVYQNMRRALDSVYGGG